MPNLIPNVTSIYYGTDGTVLETSGTSIFHAQSNYSNLLLVYIEDGNGFNTTTLVNFSPKKYNSTQKPAFTSHWFFMDYHGEVQETVDGEQEPRSFSKFSIKVPNSVLRFNNLSLNKDTVTVVQRYGDAFLGYFADTIAIKAAHPDSTNYSVTGTVANLDALLALSPTAGNIYEVTADEFVGLTTFNTTALMLADDTKTTGDKILIAPLNQYYNYDGGDQSDIASYTAIPAPSEFDTTAYKYDGGGASDFNNWTQELTPSNLSDGAYVAYSIDDAAFFQVGGSPLIWYQPEIISTSLQTKQYNTFEISVNAGLTNSEELPDIATQQTQLLMQSIADVQQQIQLVIGNYETHLGDTGNPHQTSVYNLVDTDVPENPTTNGIILRYNTVTDKYEDSEALTTLEGTVSGHISNTSNPHSVTATQVTSTDGNVQTDINDLQGDIADIADGTTPLDYTVTDEHYISTSTIIRDAIKELDGNAYDSDQALANDISLKVSKILSQELTTLETTDKIYVYDSSATDAKYIGVNDFINQVVVELASFGIVFLQEDEYDEINDIPTYLSPVKNKLYLYDNPETAPNNYDEWLWTGTEWEKLGIFGVDLENYYTKTETDAFIDLAKKIQFYPKTKNLSGSQISKGSVVQFAGSTGTELLIKEAVASEINANPETLMGIAIENIPNDNDVDTPYVVWFGEITGLNLTGFSDGDILYFDTSTGGLTTTAPTTNKIIVAAVVKGGSGGALLVRPKWVSRDIDEVDGLQTALDGKVGLVGDSDITGDVNISGNVGIGTTSPYSDLEIKRTGDASIAVSTNASTSNASLFLSEGANPTNGFGLKIYYDGSANKAHIATGNTGFTERMTFLRDSGNVGIGTTSPSAKLHINGSTAGLEIDNTSTNHMRILSYDRVANTERQLETRGSLLRYTTNANERMRITSTGNVGIGTTTPDEKLHIANTSGGASILIETASGGSGNLLFGDGDSNASGRVRYNHAANDLALWTNGAERVTVTSDGNVGIGTTTPSVPLEVNGIIKGSALHTGGTGDYSTALGVEALLNDDGSGNFNTGIGNAALRSNTLGSFNTASGVAALRDNTSGTYNTANGVNALISNTSGSTNTANGSNAGRYIADGSTGNTTGDYNTFIGANTKALADNDQNETVIGYNAIGNGSNTVTIGNDDVTDTHLKGDVQTSGTVTGSNITNTTLTLGSFTLEYNEATQSLNFNFSE